MKTIISQNINVGVDTGKHQRDIYIRPLDIFFVVENNEEGIKDAIKEIKKHTPERVVIEATGRLELICYSPLRLSQLAENFRMLFCYP